MISRRSQTLIFAAAGLGLWYAASAALRKKRKYHIVGKTVLISGGSRGLGLLLAEEFARSGARVAIFARNEQELHSACRELELSGIDALPVVCDVSRQENVDKALATVRFELGSVDVLVNNAGIIQVGPFEEMTLDDFREAMNVHFWGALYAIMGVLPEMRRRHEGRIVNISSIGGKISVPHLLPYSASKFALTGLSEGLRTELARHNIAVTTVCPGLMRTGSPRNAIFKSRHRDEYTWFSISDSLPGISMDARRAAKQIVRSCINGDPEVVLSLPAKTAVRLHGVFPGITQTLLELANFFMPRPGGIGKQRAFGKESQSRLSPSWLTTLTERAARVHNQIN